MSSGNTKDNRPKGPHGPNASGSGAQPSVFKRPQATLDLKATEVKAADAPAADAKMSATDKAMSDKAMSDKASSEQLAAAAALELARASASTSSKTAAPASAPAAAKTIEPTTHTSTPATRSKDTAAKASPASQPEPSSARVAVSPSATQQKAPTPTRSGGGFVSHLAASLLGGVLTLGGLIALGPQAGWLPAGLGTASQERDALQKRLAALEQAQARPAPTAGLDQRLERIEAATRALADGQTQLVTQTKATDEKATALATERVQKLEEQLATLAAVANTDPQRAGRLPQIAQLTSKVAELEAALSARDRDLGQAKGDASSAAGRTQALDASVKRLLEETGSLRAALDQLRTDLGGRAKPQDVAQALEPVTQKVAALEKSVQTVTRSEQDRNANAERIVLSLELANLKRALDRGEKFGNELQAIRKLAGDKLDLRALDKFAGSGVPGGEALQSEFRVLAFKAIDAESQPQEAGVMDRMLAGAKSMVRVRKTNPSDDDKSTEATLARMEQALKAGRAQAVVDAAQPLGDRAKAALAPWFDRIKARAEVDAAVAKLESDLKTALTSVPAPKGTN